MQGVQELNGEAESQPTSSPPAEVKAKTASSSKSAISLVILALILIATLLAYSPVLFNFFNGDDYVHLTWLANAIHQPELIWRNFYTSWLDGTTTKFYRPLISVFMVSDYAMWGVNGLGFRLTNIMFHFAATAFIYYIAANLQETLFKNKVSADALNDEASTRTDKFSMLLWPAGAAAFFALHPLHPEAVAWITGRVDSVVTAFCTASIFFYIRWRRTNALLHASLAAITMILGLLSKEMAITLPAVFAWTEIIYGGTWDAAQRGKTIFQWLLDSAKRCLVRTTYFWLILAAYFVVRYFALGTFVGGYDDSLFFISNMKEFISGWLHALMTLFVPINRSLMGSHHLISKVWPAAIAGAAVLLAANLVFDRKVRMHALFQLGWLALCLIPVYKLFNIAPDLQGSRLAYLATVPVCMLLTLGMYPAFRLFSKGWYRISQTAVLCAMLVLSSYLLWNNNLPWKSAGEETTKIQNELRSLFGTIDGDPQTLFLGLPDQIDGAYTCRNALDGMTKKPQLQRDIRNCLMVNAFEPILPFGFLKESIAEKNKEILIYRWDAAKGKFVKVEISKADASSFKSWSGEALQKILSIPEQKVKPTLNYLQDGADISTAANSGEIDLDLGSNPCFNCDFIVIKASMEQPAATETGIDLLYSNDMYPDFELRRRAHTTSKVGQKEQTFIFGLRGLPEWSLGGNTHKFRLLMPPGTKFRISSIELAAPQSVVPLISFQNSGYFGTKGYLHLGPDQPEQELTVSVREIPEAKTYELEITRANLLFESQNGQSRSKVLWNLIPGGSATGQTVLNFKDFKTPGIYEIRAWALDKNGTICGAASDHVVLSVDVAK